MPQRVRCGHGCIEWPPTDSIAGIVAASVTCVQIQDTAQVPPLLWWVILGIVSVTSGLMVPAMAISGQRLGISVATTLHPPPCLIAGGSMQAITMPVQRGALHSLLTLVTCAFPVFALLLWATPIAEGLLGLSQQQRAMAQGCAAICAGASAHVLCRRVFCLSMHVCPGLCGHCSPSMPACRLFQRCQAGTECTCNAGSLQLLAVKLFLQSHLNTALERWYLAKHMKSKNKTKHGTIIATSLINNTSALLPRSAMLLVGPAALLVTLGCVICDSAALNRGVHEVSEPGEVTLYSVAPFIVPPTMTTQATARCLVFSGLLAHAVSTMFVLVLRRTRVLRSTNL